MLEPTKKNKNKNKQTKNIYIYIHTPTSKDKEEASAGQQEGRNHKSNSISVGWVTHKLENDNTKEVFPLCESSEPHIRFPSLGIQQRDWDFPGDLTLKTNRT